MRLRDVGDTLRIGCDQHLLRADCCARSATRTTIGLPPISASGLSGSRVEARRAGMTAMKGGVEGAVMEQLAGAGLFGVIAPDPGCAGAVRGVAASVAADRLERLDRRAFDGLAHFVGEHGNAVADRMRRACRRCG